MVDARANNQVRRNAWANHNSSGGENMVFIGSETIRVKTKAIIEADAYRLGSATKRAIVRQ